MKSRILLVFMLCPIATALPTATIAARADLAASGLSSNTAGHPQELKSLVPSVCAGRSKICSVLLDIPEACAGNSSTCAIAMFLHAHSGHNTKFAHQHPNVFDYDMIGVYPQGELEGKGTGWNDGANSYMKCAYNDYNCTLDPNDPVFVAGIISTMRKLGATGRIYAYGASNGANEVQILAANAVVNAALPLAGIAANSGQLLAQPTRSGPAPYDYNNPCAGTQPCKGGSAIAQLSIHGTADGSIFYNGGVKKHNPHFILYAEEDSNGIWAKQNGCAVGAPAATNISASGSPVGDTTATHFAYKGCPSTAPVELYKVFNVGHVGTKLLGGDHIMTVVLDFFRKVEAAHLSTAIISSKGPALSFDAVR